MNSNAKEIKRLLVACVASYHSKQIAAKNPQYMPGLIVQLLDRVDECVLATENGISIEHALEGGFNGPLWVQMRDAVRPFNRALHEHLLALGYTWSRADESWEDHGDAEHGPELSGGPAFDRYTGPAEHVHFSEDGHAHVEAIDLAWEKFCAAQMPADPVLVHAFDVASGKQLARNAYLYEVLGDDEPAIDAAVIELESSTRCYVGGGASPLVLVTLA